MKKTAAILAAAAISLAGASANACETLQDAMAEFEVVKDAYVAAAPNLKPEQFQIWAKHIQAFGDAMGKQDYPTACATLATASAELGLGGGDTATAGGGTTSGGGAPAGGGATSGGASTAAMEGTWTECPRGRCRN